MDPPTDAHHYVDPVCGEWKILTGDARPFSWKTVLNSQCIHGARNEGEERKRKPLEFYKDEGNTLTIEVYKIYVESVCLPQLRVQCKGERTLRNCIGRLVELLKAAEGGCIGICWGDEHLLTTKRDEPFPAVVHLLKHVKGDPHYRGYDLVFTQRDPVVLSKIAHLRRSLETELELLRWDTGKFDPSKWHTQPLESRLLDYKTTVTAVIENLEQTQSDSVTDKLLETSRGAWEWAVRYAVVTQCDEAISDGSFWLSRATQILCNLVESNEGVGSLQGSANQLFPYNKSDLPTEPAGGNFWRLNEVFGLPDPAKRKKANPMDPCILINTDSSCWLNSALVPLREVGAVRRLIFSMTPYKPEWVQRGGVEDSPLNKTAMKFVHRLQSLFSFMAPVGDHKYAFNPHVREAVDEFRHIQTGGYASGNDVSEFLGVLPDMLLAAAKFAPNNAELVESIEETFYSKTVSVSLKDPPGEEDASTPSRSEYPLMVDSGGLLEDKLMKALETGQHSLQYFEKTPKLLSVVVRRKLWDKVKNKPYISKDPVLISEQLCLDPLHNNEECISLRKKLMKAEHLITELNGYDPMAQYNIAPSPMPSCLECEVGEDTVVELRKTLENLNEHVRGMQDKRDALLKTQKEEAETFSEVLRKKMRTPGKINYKLSAVIVYQDSYRGHYWAYVDFKGKWYKCDDKAEMGELPNFIETDLETALQTASTTASTLIYQLQEESENEVEEPLPPHLYSRVMQDNAKLAHFIASMPSSESPEGFPTAGSSCTNNYETTSYEYGDDGEYDYTDGSSEDVSRYY